MRGMNNYIDYPQHLSWDPKLFGELWEWADVIHTMENVDNLIALHDPLNKPMVLHHHGEIYRHYADHLNETAKARNIVMIGSTIDLSSYGPTRWLPNPIDVIWMQAIRHQYRPPAGRNKIRFSHSPTAHRAAKGTDQWVPAVQRAGGEMILIQNRAWHDALKMKAGADVHLDQLVHAYGLSGLEAMAMKIPVVSSAYPDVQVGIEERIGYLPYYAVHGTIDETLTAIIDPKVQAETAERAWQYINDYHAQDKVVARLKRLYAEARQRFRSGEMT